MPASTTCPTNIIWSPTNSVWVTRQSAQAATSRRTGRARCACAVRHTIEGRVHQRTSAGKAISQELLLPREHVHGKDAALRDERSAARGLVDADQHQRRLQRYGAEAAHGDAMQLPLQRSSHYRDAGGKAAHHVAELLPVRPIFSHAFSCPLKRSHSLHGLMEESPLYCHPLRGLTTSLTAAEAHLRRSRNDSAAAPPRYTQPAHAPCPQTRKPASAAWCGAGES